MYVTYVPYVPYVPNPPLGGQTLRSIKVERSRYGEKECISSRLIYGANQSRAKYYYTDRTYWLRPAKKKRVLLYNLMFGLALQSLFPYSLYCKEKKRSLLNKEGLKLWASEWGCIRRQHNL